MAELKLKSLSHKKGTLVLRNALILDSEKPCLMNTDFADKYAAGNRTGSATYRATHGASHGAAYRTSYGTTYATVYRAIHRAFDPTFHPA